MARPLLLLFIILLPALAGASADFETAAESYRNKNYPLAYQQFRVLADAGDPRAQTVIAMMHKYGESVPADPTEAFAWYRRAAEAGYAPAQFNVGQMYATGTGVEADRNAAIAWLTRAAGGGYALANEALAALDADIVANIVASDPNIPWSQSWDLRLPNAIRYGSADRGSTVDPLPASFRVQIGAMGTETAAVRLWHLMVAAHPDLFAGLGPTYRRAEDGMRGVVRVQVGPFDSEGDARTFCEQLLARQADTGCLPLRTALPAE